jgi:hypothetical protein
MLSFTGDNMNRSNSLIAGIVLIALGAIALLFSLSGVNLWFSWRWWPTVVIGFGAVLAALPIFIRKRWMGLLYIIAAPIIATGIMLLISMTSGSWFLWARWWPIGVLSLALGFAIAALYAREVWLAVPAIFLGVNGGIFLFNMLVGQWYLWKVLWILQPLSLGMALLFVGLVRHSSVTFGFGAALSVMSACLAAMMTPIFRDTAQFAGSLGALTLVALGGALLLWNVKRAPRATAIVPTNGTGNNGTSVAAQ